MLGGCIQVFITPEISIIKLVGWEMIHNMDEPGDTLLGEISQPQKSRHCKILLTRVPSQFRETENKRVVARDWEEEGMENWHSLADFQFEIVTVQQAELRA